MSSYRAEIAWTASGDFADNRYSRVHQWRFDGGAKIIASASPAIVPVPMSDPAGVDPEAALVAAVSSCHMLWFLDLARRAGLDVTDYRDEASGTLAEDERGRMAMTRILLAPAIGFAGDRPSDELLQRLHDSAHDHCFIANSLRGEVLLSRLR